MKDQPLGERLRQLSCLEPVLPIVIEKHDAAGSLDDVGKFVDELRANNKTLPSTLTSFYSAYINWLVGGQTVNVSRRVLQRLGRLAFLQAVRNVRLRASILSKVLLKEDHGDQTLGLLELSSASRQPAFVFRQPPIQHFLMACFLARPAPRGFKSRVKCIKEVVRRLPDMADVILMTIGLMDDRSQTGFSRGQLLRYVLGRKDSGLTRTDLLLLTLCAIYESGSSPSLIALLDNLWSSQILSLGGGALAGCRHNYVISAVGALLKASPQSLHGLRITDAGLTQNSICLFSLATRHADICLKMLNLSGNTYLGSTSIRLLQQTFAKANSLTHLNLTGCGLDGMALALLSQFLMCMPLSDLHLSHNKLGDAGLVRLASQLRYCPTLSMLDLGSTHMTDKAALALCGTLPSQLQMLDLRSNQLKDVGALAVSRALSGLTSLTTLIMAHNSIGADGAVQLALALPGALSLRNLDLSDNCIPSTGVLELKRALHRNKHLHVDVRKQRVNEQQDLIPLDQAKTLLYNIPYPRNQTPSRHQRTKKGMSPLSNSLGRVG